MLNNHRINSIKSLARTVRGLSIDAVQKANSGHPGLPLGCADVGSLLYSLILKHNPAVPHWADRDRFVLSAGHGSMLLYSLLHLCGYGLSIDDLKAFRQLGSLTPGHPEYGLTAGVETTTGPLGAGFATAVGMAIAETQLAATFNISSHKIVDHFTYVLAGDGCLMEGVSSEAASLAGHLGLNKLIVLYDSNRITIEGETDLAFTENVTERFKSYGWHVQRANGYDLSGLYSTIGAAKSEIAKPSLIVIDTVIGYGSPNKAGSHDVHGSPLGAEEVRATKQALGLNPEASFAVADSDYAFIEECRRDWQAEYDDWKKDFANWSRSYPELRASWDQFFGSTASSEAQASGAGTSRCELPAIQWPGYEPGAKLATRAASGAALQKAAAALPNLIGGSADLSPSNNSFLKGLESYQKGNRLGRNLHYGVREHAMGNILNGIVLHGGLKSFAATFLVFSDYMRPPIRMAALMKIPSIFLFTHDSFWVGEDGPTHQPTEHLATLRAISGLEVFRSCDAEETNLGWQLALEKRGGAHQPVLAGHPHSCLLDPETGPTAFAFSRQNLPVLGKPAGWQESVRKFGAWVAFDTPGGQKPDILILASGSEVAIAFGAAQQLQNEGKKLRVVAVPSLQRLQAAIARGETAIGKPGAHLLPDGVHRYAIEAGNFMSWGGLVGRDDFLGVNGFGECGPGEQVAAHFSMTVEGLVRLIKTSGTTGKEV